MIVTIILFIEHQNLPFLIKLDWNNLLDSGFVKIASGITELKCFMRFKNQFTSSKFLYFSCPILVVDKNIFYLRNLVLVTLLRVIGQSGHSYKVSLILSGLVLTADTTLPLCQGNRVMKIEQLFRGGQNRTQDRRVWRMRLTARPSKTRRVAAVNCRRRFVKRRRHRHLDKRRRRRRRNRHLRRHRTGHFGLGATKSSSSTWVFLIVCSAEFFLVGLHGAGGWFCGPSIMGSIPAAISMSNCCPNLFSVQLKSWRDTYWP